VSEQDVIRAVCQHAHWGVSVGVRCCDMSVKRCVLGILLCHPFFVESSEAIESCTACSFESNLEIHGEVFQ